MATNDLFYGIGLVLFKPSPPTQSSRRKYCPVVPSPQKGNKEPFRTLPPFISREVVLSIDSKGTSSNVYDPLWNIKCQCRIATHTKKYPFSGQEFHWRQKKSIILYPMPRRTQSEIGSTDCQGLKNGNVGKQRLLNI